MSKKVLFSHSYFYPLDPKQWKNKTPYPPLATILAAAFLRDKNYEVQLFDTNLKSNPSEIEPLLEQHPDYFVLYDDGFNYLSKMCLSNMRNAALEMIKMAKAKGLKVAVSSSDSSDHFEKYLNAGADCVLIGEAEDSLLEVLTKWDKEEDLDDSVLGIAFRKGEQLIKNKARPIRKNLDEFPLPAWDLVDVDAYKSVWSQGKYDFHLNLATTRGCPFKCNWCAKPIYGNRYNSRTPQHVVQEVKLLVEHYQCNNFWMCDDIFGLKPGWVQEFNQELKKNKLNIRYKIQSRADLLVKEDTIEALAQSGCYEVWLGAESGSQSILDAMDKGTKLEEIKESTLKLQKHGVRVAYFLQFGYLGESKEDIQKTVDMIKSNKPNDIGVSVSYPLPGTIFYEKVKAEMKDKQNWTDSDDLAMMFQGTFNSSYYKTLHRYIHRIFRTQLGKRSLTNLFKAKFSQIEGRYLSLLPYNYLLSKKYQLKLSKLNNKQEQKVV